MAAQETSTITVIPLSHYDWSLAHFGLLKFNPTVYCLVASFFAIAFWLVIDITAQVHLTFKRYRGLYYTSIICTTWGIAFHGVAFLVKLYVPSATATVSADFGTTSLAKLGWVMNTTGFSIVLYSRLSLVVQERRILRVVLAVICVDAILFHIPIIVFSYGFGSSNHSFWLPYLSYMERIQIVGFTLQDFALSTFYTVTSFKLLSDHPTSRRRNLFISLLFAQAFTLLADIAMVATDFDDMFALKACLHPFIYAMKLKVEFLVLNQLTHFVRRDKSDFMHWAVEAPETQAQLKTASKSERESIRSNNGGLAREPNEKELIGCLRCQSLVNVRQKSKGLGAEVPAAASDRATCLLTTNFNAPSPSISLSSTKDGTQFPPDARSWSNEVSRIESRELEDLERQYLGKYT
jgi:hypothetical protein